MDGSALEQAGGARRAHAHALLATNANPTRKKPAFCPRSRCTRAAPPTALSAAVGFPEEAAEPRASVPASPHGGAKEGGGLPSAGAALPPSPLLPYEASTDPLRRIPGSLTPLSPPEMPAGLQGSPPPLPVRNLPAPTPKTCPRGGPRTHVAEPARRQPGGRALHGR